MGSTVKEQALGLNSIPMILLASFGFIITRIVWLLLFHPLSHIPGPFLAKVTDLWHLYHCWGGKRHHKLIQLHERYGKGFP